MQEYEWRKLRKCRGGKQQQCVHFDLFPFIRRTEAISFQQQSGRGKGGGILKTFLLLLLLGKWRDRVWDKKKYPFGKRGVARSEISRNKRNFVIYSTFCFFAAWNPISHLRTHNDSRKKKTGKGKEDEAIFGQRRKSFEKTNNGLPHEKRQKSCCDKKRREEKTYRPLCSQIVKTWQRLFSYAVVFRRGLEFLSKGNKSEEE